MRLLQRGRRRMRLLRLLSVVLLWTLHVPKESFYFANAQEEEEEQTTTTNTTLSSCPCGGCDDDDNSTTQFVEVAQIEEPRRVILLHLALDGCLLVPENQFRTSRMTWTIEPTFFGSNSNNTNSTSNNNNRTILISTYPPNLIEPVYSYSSNNVGVLSFAMTNVTKSITTSSQGAGVRIQIPFDQLVGIKVDYGNPFFVQLLQGFTNVAQISLLAGYQLQWGHVQGRGVQFKGDLQSNQRSLSLLEVKGNGAVVDLDLGNERKYILIESLQIQTVGSSINIKGGLRCNVEDDCYLMGGSTWETPSLSSTTTNNRTTSAVSETTILLEGSIQGFVSTINVNGGGFQQQQQKSAQTPIKVFLNDPSASFIDPCLSFLPEEGGAEYGFFWDTLGEEGDEEEEERNSTTTTTTTTSAIECTTTNETVSILPWFSCITPTTTTPTTTTNDVVIVYCSAVVPDATWYDTAEEDDSSSDGTCLCSCTVPALPSNNSNDGIIPSSSSSGAFMYGGRTRSLLILANAIAAATTYCLLFQ